MRDDAFEVLPRLGIPLVPAEELNCWLTKWRQWPTKCPDRDRA